jgi:hypothetical protein
LIIKECVRERGRREAVEIEIDIGLREEEWERKGGMEREGERERERENDKHSICIKFPADYPPAKLLFANRVDIRAVGTNGRNPERLVKHLHNAIALDFHYR